MVSGHFRVKTGHFGSFSGEKESWTRFLAIFGNFLPISPFSRIFATFFLKTLCTNRKKYEDRSSRSKSPPRGGRRERGEGGGRGAPQVYYRLKIKNLTTRFDWRELKDFFREKVGGVTYTEAHTDRENTGVVEFRHKRDAMKAYDKYDDYSWVDL